MGQREDVMRDNGLYYCPHWCIRPPDEEQWEQHQSDWREMVTADRETIRVRAWGCWFTMGNDQVEVEILPAGGTGALRLTTDDLNMLRDLLDDAEGDIGTFSEVEAWKGAEDEAEGIDEDEAA
jgi:hypothetical protein